MKIFFFNMCDNRCQLFHKENFKKEEFLRMKWFLKNQQKLIDNLGIKKSIAEVKIEKIIEKKPQEEDKTELKISRKYVTPWRKPNLDGSININIMKPIEPDIRAILYEKGVESFICSSNYFHKRLQKLPEDRFYYPDCTNWLYGWHLKDHDLPPPSKFGAKAVMQAEFYQRTASCLQRNPDWYRNCQTNNPKNFNDLLTY